MMLPVHVEGAYGTAGAVAGPGDVISSKSTTGSSAHPSLLCFATVFVVFYRKGRVELRSFDCWGGYGGSLALEKVLSSA